MSVAVLSDSRGCLWAPRNMYVSHQSIAEFSFWIFSSLSQIGYISIACLRLPFLRVTSIFSCSLKKTYICCATKFVMIYTDFLKGSPWLPNSVNKLFYYLTCLIYFVSFFEKVMSLLLFVMNRLLTNVTIVSTWYYNKMASMV